MHVLVHFTVASTILLQRNSHAFIFRATTAFYVMEEKTSKLINFTDFFSHSCVGAILSDLLLTRTKSELVVNPQYIILLATTGTFCALQLCWRCFFEIKESLTFA